MEKGIVILASWVIGWIAFFWIAPALYRLVHKAHPVAQSEFRMRKDSYFARLTLWLLVFVTIFYAVMWTGFFSWQESAVPVFDMFCQWAGFVCGTVGFIFFLWSRYSLGFLSNKEVMMEICDAHVVTGLYRWSSHPMYIGLLLILLGSVFIFQNYAGLFVLVVVISPIIWMRSRIESH